MSSLVNLHSSSGHSRSNFLPSLAKLANSPFYQDVRIVCSDGVVVRWNRFLLAANSSMLAKCLFDSWQSDEDDSVVVVPGLSSATLGTMLACTLNRAVRGDILSVNEQQAMGLLGFSLLNGSGEGQNIKDRRTQQYQQLLVSSKTLPPSKRMLSVEIQEEEDNDEEDTSDDGEMSSDESLDPTTLGQVTGESDLTQHESLCHQEGIVNDKSKFTQEDNVSTEFSDIPEVQDVGLDTISMSADLLEVEERSLLDNNISEEITEELTGNKLKHCGGTGPHDVNGAISDGKGLLVINGELDTDIENALEDSASVLDTPRREDEVVKLSNHAGGSVQDQDANNPFSPNNRSPSPRFKDKSHRARLVCPEPSCKLSFERAAHLEQHVAAHRNSSVGGFECGECGKRFFHMANLRAHERYHVDRALMLSCPHCEKTFKGKRVLANHVKSAHFLAKCPHCDEEMPRNRLNGHLREVHQVKRVKKSDSDEDPDHRTYACEFCKKKFSTPNALMHHRRVHDGDPPPEELEPIGEDATGSCVRCSLCQRNYATPRHLRAHQRRDHTTSECEICGKLVKDLAAHVYNVHSEQRQRKKQRTRCTVCAKEFATHYAAKYHFKKAHGGNAEMNNRETCRECNKECSDIARHRREVHAENRHECTVCGHFFPVKESLERHVRHVHHGVKTPCPYCEKEVLHLATHLVTGHDMAAREARQLSAGLTGRSAARTDLQWTAFSQQQQKMDLS